MNEVLTISFEGVLPEEVHHPFRGDNPPKPGQYVIHASQGQGDCIIGGYDDFKTAKEDVERHDGEAAFGIKYPSGRWHRWTEADNERAYRRLRTLNGWRDGEDED